MGMLFAHRLRGDQPVAELRRERFNRAGQRLRFRPRRIVRNRHLHRNPPGFVTTVAKDIEGVKTKDNWEW